MSFIIHKVLFEKLEQHPQLEEFKSALRTVSGQEVQLLEKPVPGTGGQLSVKIDVRGVLVGVIVVDAGGCGGEQKRAIRHLLTMAAEHFASILAMSNAHDHEHLPAVVSKTCQWIRIRAHAHDVRLDEAAQACGLSSGHLSRLFHQSTGMTFQEYVRRFRLERACELLTTTRHPITEIAFESGFQSISQFHRSFKAVYGERPSDYRKRRSRG